MNNLTRMLILPSLLSLYACAHHKNDSPVVEAHASPTPIAQTSASPTPDTPIRKIDFRNFTSFEVFARARNNKVRMRTCLIQPNSVPTFRLPTNLPVGTQTVTVRAHNHISNAGTIRIVQ